jgi:7-cyano-7-deazaguanine synthase
MQYTKEKAVVLFTGGIDSSVLLYESKKSYEVLPVYFDQRTNVAFHELSAVDAIVKTLGLSCEVLAIPEFPPTVFGVRVPRYLAAYPEFAVGEYSEACGACAFFARAFRYAGVNTILIGVNKSDAENYPALDDYLAACENYLNVGVPSEKHIKYVAPLRQLSKCDVVKRGLELDVPLASTWSCLMGPLDHCGVCAQCLRRVKAFSTAGVKDTTRYRAPVIP